MTKRYEIKGIRNDETTIIGTFEPLEIGIIIKWGGDEQEDDGLKQWKVIREI